MQMKALSPETFPRLEETACRIRRPSVDMTAYGKWVQGDTQGSTGGTELIRAPRQSALPATAARRQQHRIAAPPTTRGSTK